MVQGDAHHNSAGKLTDRKPLPDCMSAYTASSPACAAACLPSELGMADEQQHDTGVGSYGAMPTASRLASWRVQPRCRGSLRTRLLAPTESPCGRRCCMMASDRDSPKSAIFTTPSCNNSDAA